MELSGELPSAPCILGVGVDLAELTAASRAVRGRGFLKKAFHASERVAYASQEPWDIARLTIAFTLKEAFLKALGTGWALGMEFHEIVGPPEAPEGTLCLYGRAAEVARERGVGRIRAGWSLHGDVVAGWVILEESASGQG